MGLEDAYDACGGLRGIRKAKERNSKECVVV